MKTWMKNGLIYVLALLSLFAGMCWTVRAKDETIDAAYRTAQETLRATELTQYITNLEFSIRYGKTLENYFNMDSVLQSILRTSPYIEGAYIVSSENVLLYSAGEAMPEPESMTVLHNSDGALYASYEHLGYAFMFMDIARQDGSNAGTLIVMLNNDIMNRLIASYQQEGRVQSLIILLEVFLLFIILHTRFSVRAGKRLSALGLSVMLALTVLCAQAVDIGIETAKLSVKMETITSQSVQKIAQVLQQQVEDVMDKGVSVDDMYDIYGWLDDIDEKLDSVDRLDFTQEGRVRAVMDREMLRRMVLQALLNMLVQYAYLAAACAALCAVTGLASYLVRKRRPSAGKGAAHAQSV